MKLFTRAVCLALLTFGLHPTVHADGPLLLVAALLAGCEDSSLPKHTEVVESTTRIESEAVRSGPNGEILKIPVVDFPTTQCEDTQSSIDEATQYWESIELYLRSVSAQSILLAIENLDGTTEEREFGMMDLFAPDEQISFEVLDGNGFDSRVVKNNGNVEPTYLMDGLVDLAVRNEVFPFVCDTGEKPYTVALNGTTHPQLRENVAVGFTGNQVSTAEIHAQGYEILL
ncbi:MAG: hypothetical protein AAB425_08660, partial [Bdellovibrionota bacterium]